jgi:hypothetical protein
MTSNKRLFVTEDGRIGLAPPIARQGDRITIFFGARVPYIIRKISKSFRLVGECYVYGVMDGEFMRFLENEEEQLDIVDFCLE